MSLAVVKSVLAADLVSRSAASVVAANTNMHFVDLSFMNTGNVPRHLMSSLSMLLFGVDNSASLATSIVAQYGSQESQSDHSIELAYMPYDSAVGGKESCKFDTPGGEYGLMTVLVKLGNPLPDTSDPALIEDIHRRIKYLIDYANRGLRATPSNKPALATAGIDNALDPNYGLMCRYAQYANPPNSTELATVYRLDYVIVSGA